MTAPTNNRPEVDDDMRDRVSDAADADANNRAVERVISLLNEIVERGALPAL